MRYSRGDLLGYAVLTFTLYLNSGFVRSEGAIPCKDLNGKPHKSGYLYSPGPGPCIYCICENGNPKWCKPIICFLPEEDCKSFRRSNECCEFFCLDDTLSAISHDKPDGTGGNIVDSSASYDLGLRLIASFITAILSMSLLFFLIHRLRQRKIRACVAGRQNRELTEEQNNLNSMGYLERGGLPHSVPMDDMPCGGGYPLWKPPGNYFPRGEAPPPYEEAIAAARAEQALLSSMSPHTLSPLNFPSYLSNHSNHANLAVATNSQTGLAASTPALSNNNNSSSSPLISSSGRPLSSPNTYTNYHEPRQNENPSGSVNAGISTTSFTLGTNTYENLPAPSTMVNVPSPHLTETNNSKILSNAQSNILRNYQQHTTLPRQSGAFTISASLPDSNVGTHRTIPRTLTTRNGTIMREIMNDFTLREFYHLQQRPVSLQNSQPHSAPPIVPSNVQVDPFCNNMSVAPISTPKKLEEKQPEVKVLKSENSNMRNKPTLNLANEINEEGSFDSVTCTCSSQALPTLHDDTDDYRSECENCKSATGSRYYLDNEDLLVTSPHETMTLHRRPEEATSGATSQYYRTSLTLPTSTRQRTRSTGVRENWFNTMPQSSTESSDEN